MGVAHHAVYPVWFELGRTDILRAAGGRYRDLEATGVYLVVVELNIKFRKPARYDDLLELRTTLAEVGGATLKHHYELYRNEELLTTAATRLACVDATGRARRLPEELHS